MKRNVPKTGIEPARLSTLAPETSASTIPPLGHLHKKRAENETRTRDPNLGKVVLYQLSYFRIFSFCECKVTTFSLFDKKNEDFFLFSFQFLAVRGQL